MAEAKRDTSVKKGPPLYSHGETKPEVGEGYDYVADYHYQNRDQIVGWRKISTTGHSDPEGFFVPPEAEEQEAQVERARSPDFPAEPIPDDQVGTKGAKLDD